jgi:hypothetical protein
MAITWFPERWIGLKLKDELLSMNQCFLWKPGPDDLWLNRDNTADGLRCYIAIRFRRQHWFWRIPADLASTEPAHATLAYGHTFDSYESYWGFVLDAKILLDQAKVLDCWFHLDRSWHRRQAAEHAAERSNRKRRGRRQPQVARQPAEVRNQYFSIRTTSPGGLVLLKLQLLLGPRESRDPQNLHISIQPGAAADGS